VETRPEATPCRFEVKQDVLHNSSAVQALNPEATRKNYRIACGHVTGNFGKCDSGAGS
jgi:hypothetical protein